MTAVTVRPEAQPLGDHESTIVVPQPFFDEMARRLHQPADHPNELMVAAARQARTLVERR